MCPECGVMLLKNNIAPHIKKVHRGIKFGPSPGPRAQCTVPDCKMLLKDKKNLEATCGFTNRSSVKFVAKVTTGAASSVTCCTTTLHINCDHMCARLKTVVKAS